MAQSTASTSSLSTLLVARMRPLCRSATRQERVGVRLLTLTLGLVMVSGRSMLTRVLMALGLGWRDWSAPIGFSGTPVWTWMCCVGGRFGHGWPCIRRRVLWW